MKASIDVDAWLGRQIPPAKGTAAMKDAVMRLLAGGAVRFNKYSGVQEWTNVDALFVNVDGGWKNYDNNFDFYAGAEEGAGDADKAKEIEGGNSGEAGAKHVGAVERTRCRMTWFAGSKVKEDSALVRRLADPDGGVLPPGRFAVHVGCALDDFPSAVLDDPDGRPAALLWWFGDAAVMDAVLRRPAASRVAWIHSGAAGVEHILKHPEIRSAPAPLTNAKGAFSASLGEWSIFAFMWFAKRVGAMRAELLASLKQAEVDAAVAMEEAKAHAEGAVRVRDMTFKKLKDAQGELSAAQGQLETFKRTLAAAEARVANAESGAEVARAEAAGAKARSAEEAAAAASTHAHVGTARSEGEGAEDRGELARQLAAVVLALDSVPVLIFARKQLRRLSLVGLWRSPAVLVAW